ncbi:FAD-binding protein [Sutterella wadsworthensis]|uniref:FAD-binding protein n=1 Tax=Sutterella wadsworthensis TaxID=40545 RepID=UPI003966D539
MMTQYAAGHINQDLVKVFCEQSGAVVDWYGDRLAERGVELWHESGDKDDHTRYEHFAIGHSPRWAGKTTEDGKKLKGNIVLVDYAKKLGARFDYNTRMVKLEKQAGRVTGCIAETGDGIRACLWAGAAMDETHSTMLFDRCALRIDQPTGAETAKKGDSGFFWIGSQPWLKVNADGKRFFNESGTYENILHADEYQKGHCHYTLFDANWPEQTKQFKMHGCSRVHPFENGADPNILWSVFAEKMLPGLIEKGFVVKADTIEELARKLGLPEKTLKATVERYNTLAQNGKDEDYGKEPHRLAALTKAPFYGAKNTGYILCTMDGIRIDTTMNAIDTDGNPIPGLYVIGNDSGGFFANTYPNLATGVACGRTVTFGRLVGKHLAKA